MTKKKSPADKLPKRAPKKTGKKGVGPALEPEEELLKTPENAAKRKPRQARLPQMEDPEIEELESAAEDYADIRDQRMELTPEENRLKTELLGLMKKHDKTTYFHDGFEIKVVAEKETVKVRIHKEETD